MCSSIIDLTGDKTTTDRLGSFRGALELDSFALLCTMLMADTADCMLPLPASMLTDHERLFNVLVEDDAAKQLPFVSAMRNRHDESLIIPLLTAHLVLLSKRGSVQTLFLSRYLRQYARRGVIMRAVIASNNDTWFSMVFAAIGDGSKKRVKLGLLAVAKYGFLPRVVAEARGSPLVAETAETDGADAWDAVLRSKGAGYMLFRMLADPSSGLGAASMTVIAALWQRANKPLSAIASIPEVHHFPPLCLWTSMRRRLLESIIESSSSPDSLVAEFSGKVYWEAFRTQMSGDERCAYRNGKYQEIVTQFLTCLQDGTDNRVLTALLHHVPALLQQCNPRAAVARPLGVMLALTFGRRMVVNDSDAAVLEEGRVMLSCLFSDPFARTKAWSDALEAYFICLPRSYEALRGIFAPYQRWEASPRSDFVMLCLTIARSRNDDGSLPEEADEAEEAEVQRRQRRRRHGLAVLF